MKRLFFIVFVFALFAISGCAQKKLSREEQLAIQERNSAAAVQIYEGYTKDEIANAVEKVLYLIDPSSIDTTLVHQENRVIWYRRSLLYMVLSAGLFVETWVIDLKEQAPNKYEVSIAVAEAGNIGVIVLNPQPVAPDVVTPKNTILPEASSKLFFERLDYFLGKTNKWRTCEKIKEWALENGYALSNPGDEVAGICHAIGIEDKTPDYLEKK